MDEPSAHPPRPPRTPVSADPAVTMDAEDDGGGEERPSGVDLAGLSVAGITRRRVAWASAAFVAVWIVVMFVRQVGDAQAATTRASDLARSNADLAAEVGALQKELDLIVRTDYVAQEARSHRLGSPKEVPFSLDPSVPAPVDGAPGSASVRLGATTDRQAPLDSWLSLLFGPTD